ncbi:hypothetical protein BGZ76_004767, partial [Entomortierella beljakovae]
GETGLESSGEADSNEAEYSVHQLEGEMKDKKKEHPRKAGCRLVVSVEHMKQWAFTTISNCKMKAFGVFTPTFIHISNNETFYSK